MSSVIRLGNACYESPPQYEQTGARHLQLEGASGFPTGLGEDREAQPLDYNTPCYDMEVQNERLRHGQVSVPGPACACWPIIGRVAASIADGLR